MNNCKYCGAELSETMNCTGCGSSTGEAMVVSTHTAHKEYACHECGGHYFSSGIVTGKQIGRAHV